jgi:hypothetical protein
VNATAQQARSRTAKTPSRPASTRKKAASPSNKRAEPAASPSKRSAEQAASPPKRHAEQTLTINIPVGRVASAAAKVVAMPVAAAQRVLPAKGGLPVFLGLGTLGVVGLLEWPVAAGVGIGYAILRHGGAFSPAPGSTSNGSHGKARTGAKKGDAK